LIYRYTREIFALSCICCINLPLPVHPKIMSLRDKSTAKM